MKKNNSKGNATTHTWTDYYPMSGTLGPINYTPAGLDMTIYGGFTWNSKSIETALQGYTIRNFQDFDPEKIPKDIFIDPFLKRSAIAQDIANKRVHSAEESRIHADIRSRSGYSDTSIKRYKIEFSDFSLASYLLPAYVLQRPGHPAQILPAICENDSTIFGPKRYSITKSMAVTATATSVIALFFPQIALASRLAAIGLSSTVSGLWAKYQGSNLRFHLDARKIDQEKENNETVSETMADKDRFEATARIFEQSDASLNGEMPPFKFEASFYEALGLDPNKPVTKEDIDKAFTHKIKEAHPDQGGSAHKTQAILEARAQAQTLFFQGAHAKNPQAQSTQAKDTQSQGTQAPFGKVQK